MGEITGHCSKPGSAFHKLGLVSQSVTQAASGILIPEAPATKTKRVSVTKVIKTARPDQAGNATHISRWQEFNDQVNTEQITKQLGRRTNPNLTNRTARQTETVKSRR